jgi:hypothetical protein
MKCCSCNKNKKECEFSFKNKKLHIRNTKCKDCHSEYMKSHYKNNKSLYMQRAKQSTKKLRESNRVSMLEFLKDKSCKDCGINDVRVLEFDHKHDKYMNVSKMMGNHSWKSILEEISKCDIRCANCHKIKTHEQFNTYKSLRS